VGSGKCWLGQDPFSDKVLRVVQLVTLRLTQQDGSIFSKIGEWQAEDQQLIGKKVQLPGRKVQAGEMPLETLDRVLLSEFPGLAVTDHEVMEKTEIEASDRYRVITKYVTYEYSATVGDGDSLQHVGTVPLVEVAGSVHCSARSTRRMRSDLSRISSDISSPMEMDERLPIYMNQESRLAKASVYAWLEPQLFQALSSQHGSGTETRNSVVLTAELSRSEWDPIRAV